MQPVRWNRDLELPPSARIIDRALRYLDRSTRRVPELRSERIVGTYREDESVELAPVEVVEGVVLNAGVEQRNRCGRPTGLGRQYPEVPITVIAAEASLGSASRYRLASEPVAVRIVESCGQKAAIEARSLGALVPRRRGRGLGFESRKFHSRHFASPDDAHFSAIQIIQCRRFTRSESDCPDLRCHPIGRPGLRGEDLQAEDACAHGQDERCAHDGRSDSGCSGGLFRHDSDRWRMCRLGRIATWTPPSEGRPEPHAFRSSKPRAALTTLYRSLPRNDGETGRSLFQ